MLKRASHVICASVVCGLLGCGGGPDLSVSAPSKDTSGTSATAYAVAGGIVTAYRLDSAGQRGPPVGSTTTDANGIFRLELTESTNAPLLIVISSGSYVEPATGTPVSLSGGELTALASSQVRVAGDVLTGIVVSPVSHLIARLALHYVASNGASVDAALRQSSDLLNSHFGGIDWQSLSALPDLTDAKVGAVQINDETKAAIILAGLSMEARELSAARGLTPGGALNSFSLTAALAADLGDDGYFDGVAGKGRLMIPSGSANSYALDGQTVRGALATGIRDFLASARNASQVTVADAEPTTLSIATDANLQLFRDSGVGPTLTNTISFVSADGSSHSPVIFSGQALVSGTLNFTVNASSPAGVASLSVSQGGVTVMPGPGSALPTRFSGAFDTTKVPDGPLVFTAIATDTAGNPSTITWRVVVDNTPPAVSVTRPIAGAFYSASVPAAALATDANAVASLGETSLGISNLASTPSFSGSWTIPSAQADGPVTVEYTACDIVFNCRSVPVTVNVDRTPPIVAVTAAPPRYTNGPAQTVSFSVTAEDGVGAGVVAVYAKNLTSAGNPVSGVRSSATNTWSFTALPVLPYLDNVIVIYSIDAAIGPDGLTSAGNSGFGASAPYQQTVQSLWNNTPPSPQWAPFASYYDESNLQLILTGPDPNLVSSWSYNPSSSYNPANATKAIVDLNNSLVVHKTTTRLSWSGAPPSITDLVGANSTNTPLIAYTIPHNAATDPPIGSARFNVTVACPGCPSFSPATGDLIVDTTYSGIRYLLPVTSDAIPPLAQVTGQATVSVSIIVTDAAGNVGQVSPAQQFQFALVPPPVALLEDQTYATSGDPRAAFAFKLANNTYAGILTNSAYPTDTARFARFIAYNPGTRSLALSVKLAGDSAHASAAVERWESWSDYAPDNSSSGNCYQVQGVCANDLYDHSPCGGGAPTAYLTAGGTACTKPSSPPAPEMLQDVWTLNALPFALGPAGEELARIASNNGVVVPASAGSSVGRVSVYLSVPSRDAPSTLTWDASTHRYQYLYARYDAGSLTTNSCLCDRSGPASWCPASYGCYPSVQPWFQYLSQADSKVFGSLTFSTSNLLPDSTATVLGNASPNSQPIVFSRVIPH